VRFFTNISPIFEKLGGKFFSNRNPEVKIFRNHRIPFGRFKENFPPNLSKIEKLLVKNLNTKSAEALKVD